MLSNAEKRVSGNLSKLGKKQMANVIKGFYDQFGLAVTSFKAETEGEDYNACRFMLDGHKILFRSAKITPKKVGQFVTCWKRNADGITAPYSIKDPIDFYVIHAGNDKYYGQFVFPGAVLIQKRILSNNDNGGKRGFRIYPPWDMASSKQAIQTQKWQRKFFLEFNEHTSPDHVRAQFETL